MKRLSCFWLALCVFLATPAPAPAATSISLDVRDLDVYDVVRLLATQADVNLVVDASVAHHPITLRLLNVSFDEALATLVRMDELAATRIGREIYLATLEATNRRYGFAPSSRGATKIFDASGVSVDGLAKILGDALPKGTLILADARMPAVVVTGSAKALERAEQLVAAFEGAQRLQSVTIPMRYVKAADAMRALQGSIKIDAPNAVFAAAEQNALLVTGTSDFVDAVTGLVPALDRPGRQVRYEVRVTDIAPSDASNVGVLFGGVGLGGQPTAGSTSTAFLQNSLSINATINALVTKGEASILAQPSLSTLNNVEASLLVGQQFPVVYFDARTGTQQVQFVNVGVNLTVKPTVGVDGAITTDLQTDYSTIVNFVENFPVIGTRRAQSTLRVQDGQTIVIAGLFQDLDASTVSKVPFIGDIPVLGELFKNRIHSHTRDEVVFLITPHLVADAPAKSGT